MRAVRLITWLACSPLPVFPPHQPETWPPQVTTRWPRGFRSARRSGRRSERERVVVRDDDSLRGIGEVGFGPRCGPSHLVPKRRQWRPYEGTWKSGVRGLDFVRPVGLNNFCVDGYFSATDWHWSFGPFNFPRRMKRFFLVSIFSRRIKTGSDTCVHFVRDRVELCSMVKSDRSIYDIDHDDAREASRVLACNT